MHAVWPDRRVKAAYPGNPLLLRGSICTQFICIAVSSRYSPAEFYYLVSNWSLPAIQIYGTWSHFAWFCTQSAGYQKKSKQRKEIKYQDMSIIPIYTTNCARFWSFSHGAPSLFVLPPEAALEGGIRYVQISSLCERASVFFCAMPCSLFSLSEAGRCCRAPLCTRSSRNRSLSIDFFTCILCHR